MPETTRLNIDDLRTDGGTQPRSCLDEATIFEYARAMERGVEFPPVQVMYDGSDYWLFDGFHRLEASCELGRDSVKAQVHQGTHEDAQWASLAANKAHGLRRTREDKRRAIKKALRGWGTEVSNNAIARHVGCSDATVGKYRKQLEEAGEIPEVVNRKATRAGRVYTQNTENVGAHTQKEEDSSSESSSEERSSSIPDEKEDQDDTVEESTQQRPGSKAVEALRESCRDFLEFFDDDSVPSWVHPELKPVLDEVYEVID